MNFSCMKAAVVGIFLMSAPAFAQTSVGPDVEHEIVLASNTSVPTEASASLSSAGDSCPTPAALAKSELSVSCHTSDEEFFRRVADACIGGRPKADLACGVIMYVVDPDLPREVLASNPRLPLTYDVQVAQAFVGEGGLDSMRAVVIKSNGASEIISAEGISRLLAPVVLNNLVKDYSQSRTGTIRSDQKTDLSAERIRYYPALFVPWGEAGTVMTPEAKGAHFRLPLQVIDDIETAMRDMMDLALRN